MDHCQFGKVHVSLLGKRWKESRNRFVVFWIRVAEALREERNRNPLGTVVL